MKNTHSHKDEISGNSQMGLQNKKEVLIGKWLIPN